MNKRNSFCHLVNIKLLFTGCWALLAFAAQSARADSIESFCSQLIETQAQQPGFIQKLDTGAQILIDILHPESMVKTVGTKITYPAHQFKGNQNSSSPRPQLSSGKNIIFLPGMTPEGLQQLGNPAAALQKLRNLQQSLSQQEPHITAMKQAASIKECVQVAEERGFSFSQYLRIQHEWTESRFERQFISEKVMQAMKTTLDEQGEGLWEIRPFTRASDLFEALRDSETANIVLTSHATPEGRLLDSNFIELPHSIFHKVSASLISLSIFSCYGPKVLEQYDLSKSMGNGSSQYQNRFLFGVETFNNELNGEMPLFGLPTYFSKIRKRVDEQGVVFQPAPLTNTPQCAVELTGFDQKMSQFGIFLNGDLLGFITPDHPNPYTFQCDRLLPGKNNITVKNLSVIRSTFDSHDKFEIKLLLPTSFELKKQPHLRTFSRDDRTLKSARFDFETTKIEN